jgi:hypothetical protein
MLLAVDPSVRSPGAALFDSAGHLVACTRLLITLEVSPKLEGQRWLAVALAIANWVAKQGRRPSELVYELPQIYTWSKSKGDPNDLIGLAGVGAALSGIYSNARVTTPKPDEWVQGTSKVCVACKGKAKKKCKTCEGSAWKTPRGQRIRSRLSAAELALVPDQNDAIDAVGIGLFVLGRLAPVRVYSSGQQSP